MRDEIEQYRSHGVQPFGVNPASVDAHASYAEHLELNFPLLSDPGRKIASAYQAARPMGMGVIRTVYLIGQDGTIRFAQRGAPGAEVSLPALESGD